MITAMPRCLVVADDVTGANATGVLLKKNGFETYTVLSAAHAADAAIAGCDCLTIATESRSIPAEEAYAKVKDVLEQVAGDGIKLYSKRIDSTLRGNLGRETDAFLDVLGDGYIAACVPCFPSSGRVLAGGYMFVKGVLLHRSEAAADPKNPITTSNAAALFRRQTHYPVCHISLDDITKGADHLAEVIGARTADGARILIFDSVNQDDIETVATALIQAGVKFFAVDPGVFTAAAARRLIPVQTAKDAGKVLCAIGSVNDVARVQATNLLGRLNVFNVYIEIPELLEGGERCEAEISRVAGAILSGCGDYGICSVIGSGIRPDGHVDFAPYMKKSGLDMQGLSERINRAVAETAYRVLKGDARFRGIYSTGGDITAAINRRLGVSGLKLLDEVVPLACYGEIAGGEFPGLKFISKGGMVGDDDAMIKCVQYLLDRI